MERRREVVEKALGLIIECGWRKVLGRTGGSGEARGWCELEKLLRRVRNVFQASYHQVNLYLVSGGLGTGLGELPQSGSEMRDTRDLLRGAEEAGEEWWILGGDEGSYGMNWGPEKARRGLWWATLRVLKRGTERFRGDRKGLRESRENHSNRAKGKNSM